MICTAKHIHTNKGQGPQKAVSYRYKLWDIGQTIKVGFIGGTETQKDFVKKAYKEISDVANLEFEYVTDNNLSDIRWSFVQGAGSWSYIGTDAMLISKASPTVNIGWAVALDVVRHEAGHSVGLAHEHMSPDFDKEWDKEQVIKDLSGPPNNWSVSQIERNVFDQLDPNDVTNTEFDEDSVMLYYFPDSWIKGGEGTKANSNWSQTDLDNLKDIYPTEQNIDEVKIFIKDLFPTKYRLSQLTETQLLVIAKELGIDAVKEDLKTDTEAKIYKVLELK